MSDTPCPACRHANRPGAKFCEECGTPLARRCASCGREASSAAKFCSECGAPLGTTEAAPPPATRGPAAAPGAAATFADVAGRLAPRIAGYTPRHLAEKILTSRAAMVGERKQVTVLFADVAGFTDLSTRLDPEDLHTIMDGCFERMMEAIHRYEGTVNQFTGDGLMALFGAPIAHEDHAVRAVAAALAVQKAIGAYGEELASSRGIAFAMRIGVNTGTVVVGRIGDDLRMDYTAQGETVNLAARLQAIASPGGVLLGETTRALVAGRFRTEALSPVTLKGFAEPVTPHQVTSERSHVLRFDLARERGLTPLAGRERELAHLAEIATDARAGRGAAVSVVGEAGIGKSRLVFELAPAVEAHFVAARGSCPPHRDAMPFRVVRQFLEATLRFEESDDEERRGAKLAGWLQTLDPALEWALPYLRHLVGLAAPELEREGLDFAQRKRRTLEALKTVVFRSAARRPVLLVVEDLQWIDASSEEALASIVDGIASHPVLLVATFRPEYRPPWDTRTIHHRVALAPLGETEGRKILAYRLGENGDDLSNRLLERAGGNPFFLEEIAGFARERPAGEPELDLPATVHGIVAARIDRLPEGLKETLQVASVLGREFPLPLLEQMLPPGEAASDVPELVRLEMLEERELVPEIRVAFANPLVQEVAYESLLVKARNELHGRAGDALERRGRDDDVRELARHFARSGRRDKALHYLEQAGDRAADLFAFEDAEDLYAQAIGVLDGSASEAHHRLLEKAGDAAWARGDLRRAIFHWEDALGRTNEPRKAASLHASIGAAYWAAAERDLALEHLEEGLRVLGGDLENAEAARLHQELGRIHFRLGDAARAVDAAERALRLGEALGAAGVVSHACNTLGLAVARRGELEAGIEWVERSLETALGAGLSCAACRAYTNLAVLTVSIDQPRSREYAKAGLGLAREIGDQLQQAWLDCALASGHCSIDGNYDEGMKAAREAIELDERLGQRIHLPVPLILLAQIHQCRGEMDASREHYERALGIAEAVGEPQLLLPCFDGLATLAIESDDEAGAEHWLERARAVEEATGWSRDTSLLVPFVS